MIGPAISPMWAIAGDYGRFGSECGGFLNAGVLCSLTASPFTLISTKPPVPGSMPGSELPGSTGRRSTAVWMNKFLTMWYLAKGTNARFYGTEVGLVLLNEENWSGPDLLHQVRFDVIQFLEFPGLGRTQFRLL